jgi:hypothetical protein
MASELEQLIKINERIAESLELQLGGKGTVPINDTSAHPNTKFRLIMTSGTTVFAELLDDESGIVAAATTSLETGIVLRPIEGRKFGNITLTSGAIVGVL